jgi:oxygen-independent coproporphyrinogen-3 oxidase
MKNRQRLGIYIHIPFCVKKCAYCDFLSFPATKEVQEKYMSSLESDIKYCVSKYGARLDDYIVDTVFFGGGTPSYVSPQLIAGILKTLKSEFAFDENPEISIECNPGTIDDEKMRVYAESGFNRCSIGLQSVQDDLLKQIGRIHTFKEFEEGFSAARNAGFKNINIDVMSALPGQTMESWEDTLEKVIALEPEHISAYSLILEEGTRFYHWYQEGKFDSGEWKLPSEEEEYRMGEWTIERLAKAGMERYEISNYARTGQECRHNLGYWDRVEYLGIGAGASSLLRNRRFSHIRNRKTYIEAIHEKQPIETEEELLSEESQMEEFMYLGLRKVNGISKEKFERTFQKPISEVYGTVIEHFQAEHLLECKGDRIFLSRRGMDVSNYVLAEFLLGE